MKRVYFLRRADGAGPIKIGCSAWPECRRKQLSWDMRSDLVLLAEAPASNEVERDLHFRFASARVKPDGLPERPWPITGITEWFEATDELLELVREVAATGKVPLNGETRDAAICRRRAAGETLQSIANDFNVTRERVRQIAAGRVAA